MNYLEKLEAAGHVLKRDQYGCIDLFVLDYEYHNGPGCINCHDSWCEHCEDEITPCIGKQAYEAKCREARFKQYLQLKEEFE
jgi:hypothetical protein